MILDYHEVLDRSDLTHLFILTTTISRYWHSQMDPCPRNLRCLHILKIKFKHLSCWRTWDKSYVLDKMMKKDDIQNTDITLESRIYQQPITPHTVFVSNFSRHERGQKDCFPFFSNNKTVFKLMTTVMQIHKAILKPKINVTCRFLT